MEHSPKHSNQNEAANDVYYDVGEMDRMLTKGLKEKVKMSADRREGMLPTDYCALAKATDAMVATIASNDPNFSEWMDPKHKKAA
jgi:hypothetical protein